MSRNETDTLRFTAMLRGVKRLRSVGARGMLAGLLALTPALAFAAVEPLQLLSPTEVEALERHNHLWRAVKPELGVEENLMQWRERGFAPADIAALENQLRELWEAQASRHFGWLNQDAVERIREIDERFVARMRAARVQEAVGIQLLPGLALKPRAVEQWWRRAILRALEYDEIAEFRLVNSTYAREVSARLEGISVTVAEERRLFQLERGFRMSHELPATFGERPLGVYEQEALLDHLDAIRTVLGDERFVPYLARVHTDFARMRAALTELPPVTLPTLLELWWLRQEQELRLAKQRPGFHEIRALRDVARAGARDLLGEAVFSRYLEKEDARWLRRW